MKQQPLVAVQVIDHDAVLVAASHLRLDDVVTQPPFILDFFHPLTPLDNRPGRHGIFNGLLECVLAYVVLDDDMVMQLVEAVRFSGPKTDNAPVVQLACDLVPHGGDLAGRDFVVQVDMDGPSVRPFHQAAVSQQAHGPLLRLIDVAEYAVRPPLRLVQTWFAECGVLLV